MTIEEERYLDILNTIKSTTIYLNQLATDGDIDKLNLPFLFSV